MAAWFLITFTACTTLQPLPDVYPATILKAWTAATVASGGGGGGY